MFDNITFSYDAVTDKLIDVKLLELEDYNTVSYQTKRGDAVQYDQMILIPKVFIDEAVTAEHNSSHYLCVVVATLGDELIMFSPVKYNNIDEIHPKVRTLALLNNITLPSTNV